MSALDVFSPATRDWFTRAFAAPTAAQEGAWRAAAAGEHALVVAPTGSGKTLAAFLWALDRLSVGPRNGDPQHRCRVVYVSPMKALAVDVERNLRSPLTGIRQAAHRLGATEPAIRVGMRTGDTPAEERRYLRALKRYQHAAVFVAEADGRLVGRLSVARDTHPSSHHVADLGLMIAAGHRRRGIGRALLQQAVVWARGAGIRKLELHVFPWNEPALRLYEAFGFEREGLRREHYRRDSEFVDAILMAYRFPPASS